MGRGVGGTRRWRQTGRSPGETLYYSQCPYRAARGKERGSGREHQPAPCRGRRGRPRWAQPERARERLRQSPGSGACSPQPGPAGGRSDVAGLHRQAAAVGAAAGPVGLEAPATGGGRVGGGCAAAGGCPRAAPRPLYTTKLFPLGPAAAGRHWTSFSSLPGGTSADSSTKVFSFTGGDKSTELIGHLSLPSSLILILVLV